MTPLTTRGHPADRPITLLAPGRLEEAHARVWRRISSFWPRPSTPPEIQLLDLEAALEAPESIRGCAALAVYHDDEPPPVTLHALADALQSKLIPAIALVPRLDEHPARISGDEILMLDSGAAPVIVASALFALSERQPAIASLLRENAALRRFQQGLRGQIEKVNEELQLASQVQRDFLPRDVPRGHALEIGAFFRPCGYVSGDIYDVQRLDETHIGFFIADAVGHGVPAALMTMALARTLHIAEIRGEAGEIVSPGEALSRLNREMIRRHGSTPRFATAIYGVADLETMRITVASAGHPPALVFGPDGLKRVNADGSLLGVFPDDVYGETSFDLADDEILVVHSDGFETAFPEQHGDHHERRLPTTNYLDRFAEMYEAAMNPPKEGAERERGLHARAGLVHPGKGRLDSALEVLAQRLDTQAGSLHQVDDLTALVFAKQAASTRSVGDPPAEHAVAKGRTRAA
ncbi:MAG: PP2C family protein-serine/threonine phosphatase [Phycisphaerales bacterium]